MPHGGRRPGAGAPKGNTNALKSGARSTRVQTIIRILMAEPETRDIITRLAARGRKHATDFAMEIARLANQIVEHSPPLHDVQRGLGGEVLAQTPDLPSNRSQVPLEARIAARIREARIIADQEAYLDWIDALGARGELIPPEYDLNSSRTPFAEDYDPYANNQVGWRPPASHSINRRLRG